MRREDPRQVKLSKFDKMQNFLKKNPSYKLNRGWCPKKKKLPVETEEE